MTSRAAMISVMLAAVCTASLLLISKSAKQQSHPIDIEPEARHIAPNQGTGTTSGFSHQPAVPDQPAGQQSATGDPVVTQSTLEHLRSEYYQQLEQRLYVDEYQNYVADVSIPGGSSRDHFITDIPVQVVTEHDLAGGLAGCVSSNFLLPVNTMVTLVTVSGEARRAYDYECVFVPKRNEYLLLPRAEDHKFDNSVNLIAPPAANPSLRD